MLGPEQLSELQAGRRSVVLASPITAQAAAEALADRVQAIIMPRAHGCREECLIVLDADGLGWNLTSEEMWAQQQITAARELSKHEVPAVPAYPPFAGVDFSVTLKTNGTRAVGRPIKDTEPPDTILVNAEDHALYRMVTQAVDSVRRKSPNILVQGNSLVRVRDDGTVDQMHEGAIELVLSERIRWRRKAKNGEYEPCWVPARVCRAFAQYGAWELPSLHGVAKAPLLRHNGDCVGKMGYDAETGYWVACGQEEIAKKIYGTGSQSRARRAAELLRELVKDFCWASDQEFGAWLAGLLTMIGRAAIDGPTPLFAVSANVRGAGKTTLANIAGIIAHGGEDMRQCMWVDSPEADQRTLGSMAVSAVPAVNFDNVTRIGGRQLDQVLTSSSITQNNLYSKTVSTIPWKVVLWTTANNPDVSDDTKRRTVNIRLRSLDGHPDRRRFGLDITQHVKSNRVRYLIAAMTILCEWRRAGRPKQETSPFGSFDYWAREIRDCVAWLGYGDCVAPELNTEPDQDELITAAIHRLLELNHATAPHGRRSAAELWERQDELKDVCSVVRIRDARELGMQISRITERVYADRRVCRVVVNGVRRYWLERVSSTAEPKVTPEQLDTAARMLGKATRAQEAPAEAAEPQKSVEPSKPVVTTTTLNPFSEFPQQTEAELLDDLARAEAGYPDVWPPRPAQTTVCPKNPDEPKPKQVSEPTKNWRAGSLADRQDLGGGGVLLKYYVGGFALEYKGEEHQCPHDREDMALMWALKTMERTSG